MSLAGPPHLARASGRLKGPEACSGRRPDNLPPPPPRRSDPLVTTDAAPDRPYKTSIVFSLKQGPGQLFKALSVFALRDIDMTKIESRPMRSNPILTVESRGGGGGEGTALPAGAQRFNYLFYVDFVGTLAEPRCQNALRHLQVRGRALWGEAGRGRGGAGGGGVLGRRGASFPMREVWVC